MEELNYHVDFGQFYVHLTRKQKKYLAVRSVIDRILAALALIVLSPLLNRLLNVSIRSRAHPVAPGRKAATEAVSSSQALLFPVLEVQTSFAVLPRNHRLMAVKVDLHTPDYRQGNVIVHAYARDAGTRVALCATSRDRCPHQGKVVV